MTSADGPAAEGDGPRYSPEQVAGLIEAMAGADFDAIEQASRYFAGRSDMAYEDLQQEAFERALTTRTCRVGTDVVAYVCGIMKSIASEAPRARKKAFERAKASGGRDPGGAVSLAFVADYDGLGGLGSDAVSPQDDALSKVYHSRGLERAMVCIAEDEELQLLVEGLNDRMSGRDLEDLLSTDTKGLAAARKRLARRLLAAFPDGAPI